MNKILIRYVHQNNKQNKDDINSFFYWPKENFNYRIKDIKKCVYDNKNINFDKNKEIHMRFRDKINGKLYWIDILNPNSVAPINNKEIFIKILYKPKNCKFMKKLQINKTNNIKNNLNGNKKIKENNIEIDIINPKMESSKKIPINKNGSTEFNILDPESMENNTNIKENINDINILDGKNEIYNNTIKETINDNKPNLFNLNDFDSPKPTIDEKRESNIEIFKNMKQREEENKEERLKNMHIYEEKIKNWAFKGNVKNNISLLLTTLHIDLLPNFPKWKKVELGDLMSESDIKKYYRIALNKLHPDKNSEADQKTKYILERVVSIIKNSYDEYRKNNN